MLSKQSWRIGCRPTQHQITKACRTDFLVGCPPKPAALPRMSPGHQRSASPSPNPNPSASLSHRILEQKGDSQDHKMGAKGPL